MSPKNETPALVLAFVITASLVSGGLWWVFQRSGADLGQWPGSSGATSPTAAGTAFASVQNVPTGLFNYGGSTTWAPIRQEVDQVMQAKRPEFRLRYVSPLRQAPGSGTGIQMLIQGDIDFAQSSRPLEAREYQQAEQRGFKLSQVPVAIDGLAVVGHPDLNLPGLTIAQLQDIYLGKITNWKTVGGPDLPIQPLARPTTAGGTIEWFIKEVLQGNPFSHNVQIVSTTTEALRQVSITPGSIYFGSAPEVVPQCTVRPIAIGRTVGTLVLPYQGSLVPPDQCPQQRNQLNLSAFQTGDYPLTRNLYVIVKQNGQAQAQAGVAYANLLLTAEGQTLIAAAGYVKIH